MIEEKDSKQAVIKIGLIGTEGQLDRPEGEYAVRYLEDQAELAKNYILSLKDKYPNFGWSIIMANRILLEAEETEIKPGEIYEI